MVINTRFSVGDHVIYRDGMEIYEVKIEKALIYKVTKLIRGNNLLETDEWKGDVNE